ncbi:MAG: hypothetical protein Q9181_007021 [Wetmoreana brouardii]
MTPAFFFILYLLRAVAAVPQCYPPNTPLKPVDMADCASLIDTIFEGDKTDAPMDFSRDPRRGFEVPHHWRNDTCVIVIDLIDGVDITMKLAEIAFSAAKIGAFCIGQHGKHRLGGRELAGPDLKMLVIMAGLKKARELAVPSSDPPLRLNRQGNSSLNSEQETS